MAKTSNSNSKKKKKSTARPNSISMKLKSDKSVNDKQNPFETIWSRRKFDIIGKKRKGEERRIGQARSIAIDKRNKTLLKEYKQSRKASVFDDKRIGELDEGLPEFDKAILRSQRERQKKIKTSKYILSDGEEDELEVNGGQWDDYDEELERGSDDDDGYGSSYLNRLKNIHAQKSSAGDAGEGEENRPKSKKEVMEEVILKSKYHKAQRAKEKEENEQLVEHLDKDFESLVQSQAFSSLTQPNKMNALKALVNPNFSKELKKEEATSVSKIPKQDGPDEYDKLVNEMMMEIRARPSDRTKTPEEIAEEEKERLEELEQERQNRMLANDDASDEEQDDSEGVGKPSANKSSHISGDDLGDSFTIDEKPQNKKGWIDEILEKDGAEDNEDESDSDDSGDNEDTEGETEEGEEIDEDGETLKDWEQSDDDVDSEDEDESDEEVVGEDDKIHHKVATSKKIAKKCIQSDSVKTVVVTKQSSCSKKELPFTIDAPANMEELDRLFSNLSNEEIIEAIRRIGVCNRISLAAENRKKIQVFYGLLLQYFATLASQKPLKFQLINLLVKPLLEMSTEIPYFSAICARERIFRIRTKFCEDIKDPDKSCWPSLKTLLLLRLWSMIFPCSDFRHAVMTPAILLMCEYLMRCPVLSVRDAAIGSFLCSLLLSVTKQSQKFCPEALTFLKALLHTAMDKSQRSSVVFQKFYHLLEVKAPIPLLCVQEPVMEIQPLDFLNIMTLPEDSSLFDTDVIRVGVLLSVVETLKGFVNIYGDLKAFPETFLPISALLIEVAHQKNMPDPLQEKLRDVLEQIRTKADEHHVSRRPLQMRKKKPVPIKLLNPKFEDNFTIGKSYDPNRERAEKRKLDKELREEARGAKRELRKDNHFLLEVKEKERQRAEQERAEKYGKAKAFLQEQEHAFKSGQLGKNRKRRRKIQVEIYVVYLLIALSTSEANIQLIEGDAPNKYSTRKYYLSPIELGLLSLDYIQYGLLFRKPPEFSTSSYFNKLKNSLSLTLSHFYPLLGRLATERYADKHSCCIYVDCNQGHGARLIHASALDLTCSNILATNLDVPSIVRSLFELSERATNYDGHTRSLLSVQVTEISDGVFLGFSINHSVADGTSLYHILTSLSELVMGSSNISKIPVFNFRPPNCCTYELAVTLPYLEPHEFIAQADEVDLRERIFHYSSTSITKLKEKANAMLGSCTSTNFVPQNLSSFQALTALTWKSITRARNLSSTEKTNCTLIANLRPRFKPPLSEAYFGVFVAPAYNTIEVGQLLENNLGWAAALLNQAVVAQDDNVACDVFSKAYVEGPKITPPGLILDGPNPVVMMGSSRFDLYGLEFGLGRAVGVRSGYGNKADGLVRAFTGPEGEGSVELQICLAPPTMNALLSDQEFMSFVSMS
ncbi:hypothetical protein KSS87_005127 [Heliosperma pusillum]|nr:hypothetical protein KSS87_005127 [Heliosperma pusillum]